MHGRGKLSWVDGSLYEGEWKNDKMEGNGKIVNPNLNSYEG